MAGTVYITARRYTGAVDVGWVGATVGIVYLVCDGGEVVNNAFWAFLELRCRFSLAWYCLRLITPWATYIDWSLPTKWHEITDNQSNMADS